MSPRTRSGLQRPADWSEDRARIETALSQPDRMAVLRAMLKTSPADAGAKLAGVRCPALVVEGSADPDWVDPGAEGAKIVAALPDGVGELAVIDGAGHYLHREVPAKVLALVLPFLRRSQLEGRCTRGLNCEDRMMRDDHERRAQQRREDGANEGPVEEELEAEFEDVVGEGAERLHRTFRATFVTGLLGGIEVGVGVLAYFGVLYATGDQLLAGLAFSIGLIALLMAHSELFTENFLMPVAALFAREGTLWELVKLWAGTLVANLLGGWLMMLIVVTAFPDWREVIEDTARHFIDAPLSWEFAALALLGGAVITLMTRMQEGTDSEPAKIVAAVAGGLVLAGFQLFHSVLDSLFAFGAILGGADIGYLDWLLWFLPVMGLNLLGGLLLVTVLRIVREGELFRMRRRSRASLRGDGEETGDADEVQDQDDE